MSLMEEDILDPSKEDRRKIRHVFSNYDDTVEQGQKQGLPKTRPGPVVTDPNVNPFPDVPLPKDFREAPLPPIPPQPPEPPVKRRTARKKVVEPATGDLTSDIEEELDRHERQSR